MNEKGGGKTTNQNFQNFRIDHQLYGGPVSRCNACRCCLLALRILTTGTAVWNCPALLLSSANDSKIEISTISELIISCTAARSVAATLVGAAY